MFKNFLNKFSKNYRLLQEVADIVGKEYEQKPYRQLSGGSLDESGGKFYYKGIEVSYSAYSFHQKKNGDIGFCIDIRANIPTFLGIKPSYQFYKTEDGNIYY
jgi:hypothetical protein